MDGRNVENTSSSAAKIWRSVVALSAFVVLPSLWLIIKRSHPLGESLHVLYCYLISLLLLVLSIRLLRSVRIGKTSARFIAWCGALFYLSSWILICYWAVVGHEFDITWALDVSGRDALFTLYGAFGVWLIPIGLILIGATLFFNRLLLWLARTCFPDRRVTSLTALLAITSAYALNYEDPLVLFEARSFYRRIIGREVTSPIYPKPFAYSADSDSSVFILQIESANAMALNGWLERDGEQYKADYMPELRKVAEQGVLFPYFWSNSIQSHRSILNALCSIDNSAGPALSFHPEKIPVKCLPKILEPAGYLSLFYWGFGNTSFTNLDKLLRHIGFGALHAAEIMPDQNVVHYWGVDDCLFYDQMFEHLANTYGQREKLFVYVKVSSHHLPFSGDKKYDFLNHYDPPTNFIEKYFNSFLQQDYCVKRFYERFQEYTSGQAHLIVFGDHSWPLGMHDGNFLNEKGAYNENFLVPFAYVPPKGVAVAAKSGDQNRMIFGLSDLTPTVLELLGGEIGRQSFAGALTGDGVGDAYEDCQLLIQPYAGTEIAVVNGMQKFVYHVRDKTVHHYDLEQDWSERSPRLVSADMEYEEFRRAYYCQRFQAEAR